MKILIVSPHPDDATFSLGGTLLRLKNRPQIHTFVWNVFGRQSYSRKHKNALLAQQEIVLEEKKVASYMDVKVKIDKYWEAADRGYKKLSSILGHNSKGQVSTNEHNLIETIQESAKVEINRISPDLIGLPMALGGHIDHYIVREAILLVKNQNFGKKIKYFFYEDLPYALNKKWYENTMGELKQRYLKLKQFSIPIERFIEGKRTAMSIYESQINKKEVDKMINYSKRINTHFEFIHFIS